MRRPLSALLAALLLAGLALALPSGAAPPPPPEREGYLTLSDGTPLRYTLQLPAGDGPFPVVLQYSGYNNGNNLMDGTFGKSTPALLERGIAVAGVNLRGSGCSGGTFSPFSPQWAQDGAEVVQWLADQPWSDGGVAMAGVSYPALVALATAVEQPPALRAVVAAVPVVDLYRDVAYPGGIWNATFSSVWTGLQKYGNLFGLQEVAEGDAQCLGHYPAQNDPTDVTGVVAATSPFVDSLDRYTDFLTPEDLARVQAPALVYSAWQDEQLGSRAMHAYEHLPADRRWVVGSNGDHIGVPGSAFFRALQVDFLDHFLHGGTPEGFDAPRVQVLRDVRDDATATEVDAYDRYPVPVVQEQLHLHADASLRRRPAPTAGALHYAYPLAAPSVPVGIDVGAGVNPAVYDDVYRLPVPAGGALAFTTPALAEDLQLHGPSSLDLWVSSTGTDVDLQVSLTEVRPDGEETYVQRGWLRASHRRLDPARTTALRPVPTHLSGDAAPLVPGVPTAVRVEVWPVDHVFRAGSALRVTVEAPVGLTGFRQLALGAQPADVTVHVGPRTPSRFVLGRTPAPRVTSGLPACGSLLNMPCRTSTTRVPEGSLSFARPTATP